MLAVTIAVARNRNAWEASFPILHLLLSPKYFTVLRIDLTVDVVNSSVLLLLSYLLGAGDQLRTSCLLGKCSTTDPCPSPSIKSVFFLLTFFFGVCLFFHYLFIYLFLRGMNFSVTDLLVGLYRFLVSSHTVSLTLTLLPPQAAHPQT